MRVCHFQALQKCSLVPVHSTMYLLVRPSGPKETLELLSLTFILSMLKKKRKKKQKPLRYLNAEGSISSS